MKKLLLGISMLLISVTIKAQTFTPEQAVFYALNQDSMMTKYARYIFMVKNAKGETIESFGKKIMGKHYEKFLVPMFDSVHRKDMSFFEAFAMSFKFKKIMNQVKKEFVEDKAYRKQLDRTWNNSQLILNEFLCSAVAASDFRITTNLKLKNEAARRQSATAYVVFCKSLTFKKVL